MINVRHFKVGAVEVKQEARHLMDNSEGAEVLVVLTDWMDISPYFNSPNGMFLYCVARAVTGTGDMTVDLDGCGGDDPNNSEWAPSLTISGSRVTIALADTPVVGTGSPLALGVSGIPRYIRLRITVPAASSVEFYATVACVSHSN
jgi:hypothetical protein